MGQVEEKSGSGDMRSTIPGEGAGARASRMPRGGCEGASLGDTRE